MIRRVSRKLFGALFVMTLLATLAGLLLGSLGAWGVIAAIGIACIVALVAAALATGSLQNLAQAASRIAAGDLSVRTRMYGEDDLGELGGAIDLLAGNLATTHRALRAERDRLETVLDGMTEGVLLLDRHGRIALVNRALRAMSLLGSDVTGKAPIEVIRNVQLTELLDQAQEEGVPISGELDLNMPTTKRVLVRTRPLTGREHGLVAVFVDVTDLRRLETVRKEFVANASHELRTPIAAIHSAAETLVAGASDDPEMRDRFLDMIQRNTVRLRQLVDDMLDLSRVEARGFALTLKPVQAYSIVEQVFSVVAPEASRKNIELSVEIPPDLRVSADPRALEHVLLNLVDNAVKYCPMGSKVRVGYELVGERVRLLVTDNGPGIDAKHLPRLFERFYRVDAGRSRELGGTGLGLAIVKHLVEAMKGTSTVESEVGKGTTFSVRLRAA